MTSTTAAVPATADPTASDAAAAPAMSPPNVAPEVLTRVDKTASYVARLGPSFETKLLGTDAAKFSFLQPDDALHAYYRAQVERIKAQQEALDPAAQAKAHAEAARKVLAEEEAELEAKRAAEAAAAEARKLDPPPEDQFVVDIPHVSAMDLDRIRLTARFVARNGRDFVARLMEREHMNPQFHFLRPGHYLYPFFNALVDSYRRIMLPERDHLEALEQIANDRAVALNHILHRVQWERQEKAKAEAEANAGSGGLTTMSAQVDWDDFVIVKQIDFMEDVSTLPPPLTIEQLRLLTAESVAGPVAAVPVPGAAAANATAAGEVDMDMEADMELSDDDASAPAKASEGDNVVQIVDVQAPSDGGEAMVIVEGYTPDASQGVTTTAERTQVCGICGQAIPVSQMEEHMKVELRDQATVAKVKAKHDAARADPLASDQEISRSLSRFAKKRADIFGRGDEVEAAQPSTTPAVTKVPPAAAAAATTATTTPATTAGARKAVVGPSAVPAKAGHYRGPDHMNRVGQAHPHATPASAGMPVAGRGAPVTRVPPTAAVAAAAAVPGRGAPVVGRHGPPTSMRPPVRGPPPVIGGHGPPPVVGGHGPPPSRGAPQGGPAPATPSGVVGAVRPRSDGGNGDALSDPTAMKRARPEVEPTPTGPVPIQVQVQVFENDNGWKMDGQTLVLEVNAEDLVRQLKENLEAALALPVKKQKVRIVGGKYFKDNMTLASYGVTANSTLQVAVHQRGGRKK